MWDIPRTYAELYEHDTVVYQRVTDVLDTLGYQLLARGTDLVLELDEVLVNNEWTHVFVSNAVSGDSFHDKLCRRPKFAHKPRYANMPSGWTEQVPTLLKPGDVMALGDEAYGDDENWYPIETAGYKIQVNNSPVRRPAAQTFTQELSRFLYSGALVVMLALMVGCGSRIDAEQYALSWANKLGLTFRALQCTRHNIIEYRCTVLHDYGVDVLRCAGDGCRLL